MSTYDMGILTFWDVPNYRTFAQAYALQRVLDKRCAGRDVKQIAYLDEKHYSSYYKKEIGHNFLKSAFYKLQPSKANVPRILSFHSSYRENELCRFCKYDI